MTCDFLPIWKLANAMHIPKPCKDHSEPSNYGSVTLTSCICKTMEIMIKGRLEWFLVSKGLLSIILGGFNHSMWGDHLLQFEPFSFEISEDELCLVNLIWIIIIWTETVVFLFFFKTKLKSIITKICKK